MLINILSLVLSLVAVLLLVSATSKLERLLCAPADKEQQRADADTDENKTSETDELLRL